MEKDLLKTDSEILLELGFKQIKPSRFLYSQKDFSYFYRPDTKVLVIYQGKQADNIEIAIKSIDHLAQILAAIEYKND